MLLSSTAENMYWTGRYFERAQAVARVVRGYSRMSLDLPEGEALDLRPVLELVGRDTGTTDGEGVLRQLVCELENPSSVRGALRLARENLRSARIVAPPEVWATVNSLYGRLSDLAATDLGAVATALEDVCNAASQLEGEIASSMTRDAAYSFWRLGCELERADMLMRTVGVLVPAVTGGGTRAFDDVRWMGLLECVGACSMYRRRFHARGDRAAVLGFLLADESFPRSLGYAARAIERELDTLPRPGPARAVLPRLALDPARVATCSNEQLAGLAQTCTEALAQLHTALTASYFQSEPAPPAVVPNPAPAPKPAPQPPAADPFELLGREHGMVEGALCSLDELSARAACGEGIGRERLGAIVAFFTDFGVAGHHEKEESILMPALLGLGFDWHDGPLAAVRRDHRQEHYFLRVLNHLARQLDAWSGEDRRQFVGISREFTEFLRGHMRREQGEIFAPASLRLTPGERERLVAAFTAFDRSAGGGMEAARARLDAALGSALQTDQGGSPWHGGSASPAAALV